MKVDASLLWQAVKNVSIFSRKDGWAGAVQVHHRDGTLRFRTSDDFVGVESVVEIGTGEQLLQDVYLSHETVKLLEKHLRDWDGQIDIFLDSTALNVGDLADRHSPDAIFRAEIIDCPSEEWWNMFRYVMEEAYRQPHSPGGPSEIDLARLSKLNLLEPKGEYPGSRKITQIDGRQVEAFKYGPNTFGVLMTLDRSKLEEAYPDRINEVIW